MNQWVQPLFIFLIVPGHGLFVPENHGAGTFLDRKNHGADTFVGRKNHGAETFFDEKIHGADTFFYPEISHFPALFPINFASSLIEI